MRGLLIQILIISIETPLCQDRVFNLGAEPSRNMQNHPKLTLYEQQPDVHLGYTLGGHRLQRW